MNTATLETQRVKLSVALITYNQEAYIAQAIESALMQRTNFEFEIVIGEDCSTDGTRAIIQSYVAQYPDQIRPLLHERNLGLYGKNNFVATFGACQGQYVALLEGDDYWTDPLKLQKQVSFLDSHPECTICFHAASRQYEDNAMSPKLLQPPGRKDVYSLKDLLLNNFMITHTVVFRNGLVDKFPSWYYQIMLGDWPLHVFNARFGLIGYIDECMAVYRVHDAGIFSGASQFRRWEAIIQFYEHVGLTLDPIYDKHIQAGLSTVYLSQAVYWLENGNLVKAKSCALQSIRIAPPFYRLSLLILTLRLLLAAALRRLKKGIAHTTKSNSEVNA
jgi:glycosyltransferase involved in cell wall biosynthesis